MGMKITPTIVNTEMTHFGVRIGLQAGSSCCVNFEYLGLLEFLLRLAASADPDAEAAALLLVWLIEILRFSDSIV